MADSGFNVPNWDDTWTQQLSSLRQENQSFRDLLDRSGTPFGYSSAARGGKGQLGQLSKFYDFLYGNQNTLFSKAEAEQRAGARSLTKGFASAHDAVARRGDISRQNILDRETQRLGQTDQNLLSRGFGGAGSVRDAAVGDQYSSTSSALGELDAALAEMDSNLSLQQGQAENASSLGLSNLFQAQAGSNLQLGQSWADILANIEHRNDNNAGSLIGGLLGLALN